MPQIGKIQRDGSFLVEKRRGRASEPGGRPGLQNQWKARERRSASSIPVPYRKEISASASGSVEPAFVELVFVEAHQVPDLVQQREADLSTSSSRVAAMRSRLFWKSLMTAVR